MSGHPDPSMPAFPDLGYSLKGPRYTGVVRPQAKQKPITTTLLLRIHAAWSSSPLSLVWAAFCLGLFGIL